MKKNTKYFHNLEKCNRSTNTVKQLKKEDGSFTISESEIIEEEYKFYKELYKKDIAFYSDSNLKEYLKDTHNLHTLDENDNELLEGEITEHECEAAIKSMKANKSPGLDGISVEFYHTFWEDIKYALINSLNEAYQADELSPTQRRGVLSLIYKKNDKTSLTNWRPISLLNTDYKILAHVLANRLKK